MDEEISPHGSSMDDVGGMTGGRPHCIPDIPIMEPRFGGGNHSSSFNDGIGVQ